MLFQLGVLGFLGEQVFWWVCWVSFPRSSFGFPLPPTRNFSTRWWWLWAADPSWRSSFTKLPHGSSKYQCSSRSFARWTLSFWFPFKPGEKPTLHCFCHMLTFLAAMLAQGPDNSPGTESQTAHYVGNLPTPLKTKMETRLRKLKNGGCTKQQGS